MRHVLLIASVLLAALPAYAAEKETSFERVIKSGVLKCGYGVSPPVLVKDANTGKLSGMDFEVWEHIGQQLGIKIEWVESSGWGTFPEDLRQGRYDVFCSQIWMTAARTKFLTATVPVAYTFLNAYVRPDETRFTSADDFNSKSVTAPVVEGDITEDMVKSRFPAAQIYALPGSSNWGDLYLAVTSKKADVFFVDPASFEAVSQNNPVKLKKLDTPPVYTFGSRYSVTTGEAQLRDMINVVIQSMIDDGSLGKIAKATSPHITVPDKNYSVGEK